MPLNLNDIPGSGGKDFIKQANIEPGTYPARVVQVLDLGLQPQRPYQGQDKPPARELMVTYELVDEFMKDEDGKDIEDKPRWISETFPLRGLKNEKAKSTERYEAFDADHSKLDGDITRILTMACNVTIVNNPSGDKVYDNVANVSAMRLRDAQNCPELKNPAKLFITDDPDVEVFKNLPKWIRDKITGNLNFKGSKLEQLVSSLPKEEKKPQEKVVEPAKEGSNNPY